jgi:DNA-binding SARP family transcriptional activator
MAQDEAVQLVVRGLGRAEVTLGTLVLVPEHGMLFPLALLLAQRCGERIARAELIELLWPGSDDAAGRHSLRQALYRLRKAGLNLDDRTDDVRLERDVVDSDLTAVLRHDWPFCAEPADIERGASVLPGFVPADGSRLAEWLDQLRARLAAQYRQATLHRIALGRREGRWREVEHWALMCLQGDSLNEEATLARAEALAMVGAKNAALEVLDTYLREIGDRARVIGLPARMLRRRISELTDTTGRRVTATSAPFIGRHDLLARAQDILALARGGEATVQWFVGPPGIGKSRLLREMSRAARMAGWCVVAGGARPSYEDRPFALLTELLPHLLEAPGALGADPDALTLMRQMGRADTGEEPLEPEEARGRQYAVYLSWVELMDAVLGEAPLAIFVDDAQWADPITLLMMARLLESRPHVKLAVILSARRVPTRDDGAAQRLLGAAQERIAPLTDEEMREFTRSVGTVSESEFDEVTRRLGAVSGGNPLFLGHLVHQHTTHRESPTMPADLATLIDEQVRTLSRDALRLLQACALLGQHATLPRVERVLGVEAPWLVTPFGELDDMLALPSEPGQPLAPHDLWTERVRHGMTAGVFRSLAVSAARVLEADAQSDGGIEIYWDAARLYQESGEKQLAYATMMRCAEYLSRSGATLESCRAFAAAVTFAGSPLARYNALSGQLNGLHAMGEFATAQPVVDELRALSVEQPEYSLSAEQEVLALEIAHFSGASDDMQTALRKLSSDASLRPECRLHAIRVGLIAADNFHDMSAKAFFSAALHSFSEQPEDILYRLRADIIRLTLDAEFTRASDAADNLIIESRRRSNRAALLADLRLCSIPSRRGGDLDKSLQLLDEAQVVAKKFGFTYGQFRAADMKAGLLLDYDQLESAKVALVEAQELMSESLGGFVRESLNLTWAFWCLSTGDWTGAVERAKAGPVLDPLSRSRHAMLAAALKLRISARQRDRDECMQILEHLSNRNADVLRFGGSDQIALAIFSALDFLRDSAAAKEFAREYVQNQRQERFPPPKPLTH